MAPLPGFVNIQGNITHKHEISKGALKMLNDNEGEDYNGQHVKANRTSGLGEDEAEKATTQKNGFDNNIENYIKFRAREQRESLAKARALARTRR